jgi:hypothetical protein
MAHATARFFVTDLSKTEAREEVKRDELLGLLGHKAKSLSSSVVDHLRRNRSAVQ